MFLIPMRGSEVYHRWSETAAYAWFLIPMRGSEHPSATRHPEGALFLIPMRGSELPMRSASRCLT